MSENVKPSVRALLTGIVDYAGLFPPAGLPMAEAVKNYAEYSTGELNWMLGRFIVPAARLDEFAECAANVKIETPWKLSVLDGGDLPETVEKIKAFNAEHADLGECDAVEIKAVSAGEIEAAADILPKGIMPYFEIAPEGDLSGLLPVLFFTRQRAKIRTGGITRDSIPAPVNVTRFIRTCLAANVPFKATAGLHHPLRCVRPLTYEEESIDGKMHGFLNVFLATAFAREGIKPALMQQILEEEDPTAFFFEDDGVWYRQEQFLGTPQLKRLRDKTAISFGSCSFTEPTEELKELGIL
jgi:hypothetical protein